jgi:hypothetical protein
MVGELVDFAGEGGEERVNVLVFKGLEAGLEFGEEGACRGRGGRAFVW